MSLYMTIGTVPKVEGYTFGELMEFEGRLHKEKDILPDDLKPHAYKNTFAGWFSLVCDMGVWRNNFSIHDWFTTKTKINHDDTPPYEVNKEDLLELQQTIKEVLFDNLSTGTHQVAEEKLSPDDGFPLNDEGFIKEYYIELQRTLYILEETLMIDFDRYYVCYLSS